MYRRPNARSVWASVNLRVVMAALSHTVTDQQHSLALRSVYMQHKHPSILDQAKSDCPCSLMSMSMLKEA